MSAMKPIKAWVRTDEDGDLLSDSLCRFAYLVESEARDYLTPRCDERVVEAVIVPADEWERLREILRTFAEAVPAYTGEDQLLTLMAEEIREANALADEAEKLLQKPQRAGGE